MGDEADVDVMGHCLDLAFTLQPGSPGAFEQRRDVMYVENWLKGQRRNEGATEEAAEPERVAQPRWSWWRQSKGSDSGNILEVEAHGTC